MFEKSYDAWDNFVIRFVNKYLKKGNNRDLDPNFEKSVNPGQDPKE